MNTSKKICVATLCAAMAGAFPAKAQDKLKVTAKGDLVSDYIWRGSDQGSDFSVQPALGLSYKGFTIGAWGSQSLTKANGSQEFDLFVAYTAGPVTLTVTDYWWNGIEGRYGDYKTGHHFEGGVAWRVSDRVPLTLGWATMWAGADDNKHGDRAFSTYISASYETAVPGDITLTPAVGFTPWKGLYNANSASFTDISLKASKTVSLGKSLEMPLFVQAVFAPYDQKHGVDKTYLLFGVSLALK